MVLLSFSKRYGFYYYEPETDIVYSRPFSRKSFDFWLTPGASLGSTLCVSVPSWVLFYWLPDLIGNWLMWILMNVLTCGFIFGSSFLCRMKIQRDIKKKGERIILSEGEIWELEKIYKAADAMDLPYFRMRGLGHGCLFIFILTTVWRAIATLVIHYDDIWPPSLFWSLEIIDLDITLYALMNTPERLRKKCMQRIAELMSLSKGA